MTEHFSLYLLSLVIFQASVLQNLRSAMRRQIRRHSSRRSSSRRRLGRLWNRLFHRGSRLRGQIPLLTPPGHAHTNTHTVLGLHSYNTVDANAEDLREGVEQTPSPCSTAALGLALQAHAEAFCLSERESPPSPFSPSSPASPRSTSDTLEDEDEDDRSSELSGARIRPKSQCSSPKCEEEDSPPGPPDSPKYSTNRSRTSRRLVQELAAELRGVSIVRYTSVGVSPLSSPESPTSSSGRCEEQRGLRKPHVDSHTDSLTDVLLSPLEVSKKSSGTEDTPGDRL